MGSTVSRNILQYHAITGCDTTSFFHRIRKISPFKEVLKKSSCLSFIECLGKNKFLSNTDIEKCMAFTQTVLSVGNNQAYVETKINMKIKELKVPWRYLLISSVLLRLLFELIINASIGFTALKKLYHQYLFKIMDDSLIVNLILLRQCGLKAISFHHR